MKKPSKTLTIFWGMGRVTVMKGSNVIDYLLQVGQVTFDLYWPVIRSVITDWLRLMWAIQLSVATSLSGRELLSIDSTYGFF